MAVIRIRVPSKDCTCLGCVYNNNPVACHNAPRCEDSTGSYNYVEKNNYEKKNNTEGNFSAFRRRLRRVLV